MDMHKCQQICESLEYNWRDFSLATFTQHIAAQRQRPIQTLGVVNLDLPMCLRVGRSDFIFYPASQTRSKQIHDVLHELAHILLGHIDKTPNSSTVMDNLIINLGIRFRRYKPTDLHASREEREAEFLAYLIQSKISEHNQIQALIRVDNTDDFRFPPFTASYLISSSKP